MASYHNATFQYRLATERDNDTDLADLTKWTDVALHGGIPPVLSDVRHDGQSGRINARA